MKALVAIACAAVLAVVYFVFDRQKTPTVTGSISGAATISQNDPRRALSVTRTDWKRDGFGQVAVVDLSVRNNNAYPVVVERISCRFKDRTSGKVEDHAQNVYSVIQPKSHRVIKDVGLGFVAGKLEGQDCSVQAAQKG